MMENCHFSPNAVEWKRINMRNVVHLMGVEFIHDLYNRHEPKINSIRFRHTVTIWKDGIVQLSHDIFGNNSVFYAAIGAKTCFTPTLRQSV